MDTKTNALAWIWEFADDEMQQISENKFTKHNDYDPKLIDAIKLAQKRLGKLIWSRPLRFSHTQWREGTIRGFMAISCRN